MNRYAKSLLYAGLVSCVLALPVQAQVNSTSNATSVSGSASGASSRAAANSGASTNQQNINFNSPGDLRSNNTNTNNTNAREAVSYSGGTTNSTYVSGDQTIRNAPTVYAPPVSGGNPCSLGVSAGASFLGWGAAAGGSYVDQDCANRQKIAMIHNAGYAGAAKELMCNDRDAYFAFRTAGMPCAPRPSFDGVAAPAPQPVVPPVAAPVPVQPTGPVVQPRTTQVAPKQYVRCNPARGITDNCVSG